MYTARDWHNPAHLLTFVGVILRRKESNMERSKPNPAVMAMLFIIGISTLVHFSNNVRMVDVVGLSGGGAACGAALFGFIFSLIAKNKA